MTQDFTITARDQVQAVLDWATLSLAGIEHTMQQLEARALQFREFVRLGDALLRTPAAAPLLSAGLASAPQVVDQLVTSQGHPASPDVTSLPVRAPGRQTAAAQAEAILIEVGHPLRVEEMVQLLQSRNGLHGKQPKESLRTAMRDHPKVFRRVSRGVYGLVSWPTSATLAR
jgi:HB1, ASXL, restriction endonuclease HTH domain